MDNDEQRDHAEEAANRALIEEYDEEPIDRRYGVGVEVGVYHNGELRGLPVTHTVPSLMAGTYVTMNVPGARDNSEFFTVNMRLGDELVNDYIAIREMWLLDRANIPIGRPRPALWYLGQSDIPLTTAFETAHARPITHAGIWVVTLRAPDGPARLRAKLDRR